MKAWVWDVGGSPVELGSWKNLRVVVFSQCPRINTLSLCQSYVPPSPRGDIHLFKLRALGAVVPGCFFCFEEPNRLLCG